ncbi:ImmA/IrrE family metallo-endopeptidase [Microbacterium sp. SLBN-111]|uniref:ImmA/IrrE family metallo-endopeptidase n=1 Tax=Microbacterium sp. SLBN-111 TaxID=3377733 RepID=UPI003C758D8C
MPDGAAPKEKIRQYAKGALTAAGLEDVSRIPVEQVAAAVGLRRRDLFELGQETPRRFRDVIKKLSGKVLGLLSIPKREYYIDRTVSVPRQRFTEAHEIGHDALPWHEAAFYGEDDSTLDPATKEILEQEANQFSAELLFGAGRFTSHADSYSPGLEVALHLAPQYGVSAHASIRKYVEDSTHAIAVMTTSRYSKTGGTVEVFDTQSFESPRFRKQYGQLTSMLHKRVGSTTYPELTALLSLQTGSVPPCEVTLDTTRGKIRFIAEGFTNGRLNFVILHKKAAISGQKLKLVSTDGFELLPG